MAWLLRDGQVLASLEVASSRGERRKGLLGRDSFDGALLIERTRSVHTFGMRFPIDVAFCDDQLAVVRVVKLPPGRLALPARRARQAIEAEAGSFARWGLAVGDRLEIKGQ